MQRLRQVAYCFIILLLAGTTGCLRSTGPTEVGVLVNKIGLFGDAGVQAEVYAPGSTYLVMPLISDWYVFDTKIQNLEMIADPTRGDRAYRDELKFKTIDGNDIELDVIITYQIIPEKVPHMVQYIAQNDAELRNNVVRSIARSVTRDIFGELKTEQFYIAEERDAKAEQAKEELNKILNPYGVNVGRVSTKDYRFNPEYQKAIEDKKVADQQAEKFKSEFQASKEEYLKKVEQAKGQVNEMIAKSNGEYERAKIAADAYFEQNKKRAEAVRAEAEAEAKGITEMNKALAGAGGEVMVKMQMAEALRGKRILLLPNGGNGIDLKSTNVNKLLETYGTQKLAEQGASGQESN